MVMWRKSVHLIKLVVGKLRQSDYEYSVYVSNSEYDQEISQWQTAD